MREAFHFLSLVTRTVRVELLRVIVTGVVIGCVLAGTARAQVNTGNVSVVAGADVTNAYFFRGVVGETKGFILQPYIETGFSLFEAADGSRSVGLTVGLWNSLHSGPSGADRTDIGSAKPWYEASFYSGVTVGFAEHWQVGATYMAISSPNQSFNTVQELEFDFAYDDSAALGSFAMSPRALLVVEMKGQLDFGTNEGVYLELGIAPGIAPAGGPVSVTFPVTAAFSLSDYYEHPVTGVDSTFGYFDVGADVDIPLGLPESFGAWGLTGSVHLLVLGDTNAAFNNDQEAEVIAKVGLYFVY